MLFGTLSPLQIIWLEQLTLEKHYPISAILQDIRTCTVKSVDKVSSDIRWYPCTNFVAKWSYFIKNTFLRSFLPLKTQYMLTVLMLLKSQIARAPSITGSKFTRDFSRQNFLVKYNDKIACATRKGSKFTHGVSRQNFLVKSQRLNCASSNTGSKFTRGFSRQNFPVKSQRFFTKVILTTKWRLGWKWIMENCWYLNF